MEALEKKEIRGLTAHNLIWIMGGIISVLITIMGTYFNIMRKLDKVDAMQGNVNVLEVKINSNMADLKNLQQNVIPSLDIRMSRMEEQMKDKIFIKEAK